MSLHPIREALRQAGLRASSNDSAFKSESEAAAARFQILRDDLERQVRRGELTLKVAREKARQAAADMKLQLARKSEGFSPVPRVFMDRLIDVSNNRKRSRETMGMEGLQRETNRLLRLNLIEQQIKSRDEEFQGRTFVRALPGGKLAPTLDSLIAFHDTAMQGGDDPAAEWARRQLEGLRSRVMDPADVARIDRACDRPETVNPRIVARYMEVLASASVEELEQFAEQAISSRDASACVASFLLARETEGWVNHAWVRNVLQGLSAFPDAALNALRSIEAETRGEESEAARAQAEYAVALAESQTLFQGVEPPTEAELARQARIDARPMARPGEPIGLALDKRGMDREQFALELESAGEQESVGL